MFDRIVLPTEGEPTFRRVFPHTMHLSDRTSAALTVLRVVEAADQHDTATALLDHLLGDVPPERPVAPAVRVGQPAQEICAEAQASRASLVALATRAARPVGEALFGSVAAEVLRRCGRPLLVFGPACEPPENAGVRIQRLLVCLDGSKVSAAVLPLARGVAESLDLSVLLYYVGYPLVDVPTHGPALSREDQDIAREVAREAASWRSHGIDADHRVESGTWPAESIAKKADSGGVDLIAMATHGHHALLRMLTGSTTHEVVQRAPVPVLTLRPSGMLH